ncbi:MAG: hypothetical protein K2W79_05180 [Hydrotalea flava]|uniref:DUF6671 family protein n=2 Tax=Hydrotalea TaxID=1004300 RepID=UPI00257AD91E|nr:DUF6671 family protein [Hydrotalea sp. AMD]MBY0347635.1 hypothetical protein [Hydrotalea flava]
MPKSKFQKMFKGRKLLIATKHQKEKVIAPLLQKGLGVECIVPENFDTDILGTFTGEVERKDDPVTTARNKCLLAMQLYDCDMAIASEGSFGPHPAMFFVYADDEIILFIDKKNDLEIIARELSTDTNFNGEEIKTEKQLKDFAKRAKFPSHGLIVRKAKEDFTEIIKGITNWEQLSTTFNQFLKKYRVAYVETDMRAMYNPSRMLVIEKALQKLIDKIKSCCPQCSTPGFGITEAKPGLPCNLCGSPTRSTLSYIYTCQKCSFLKEEMYPHKNITEDPTYCDYCNP